MVEMVSIILILVSGNLVNFDQQCISPEMQVIQRVDTPEGDHISAIPGCYHDPTTDQYWRTQSMVSSEILANTSLVAHENCEFLHWKTCKVEADDTAK